MRMTEPVRLAATAAAASLALTGCGGSNGPQLAPASVVAMQEGPGEEYISEPLVTVIVNEFAGTFSQQIRAVGATEKPASLPYRANMTLLDAMIAAGGLSEFASDNRAKLIRSDKTVGRQREYALRLGDLLKNGESRANVLLAPGDVIIIPESMF